MRYEARRAEASEKPKFRSLWEEIFSEDSAAFLDYYDREKVPGNTVYGIFDEGGRLLSMLELNPYRLLVGSGEAQRETAAKYVIAVATREEYRGRGFMRSLLRKSMLEERAQGLPFLFLMPAAEAIYAPLGFRFFYSQNRGTIGPMPSQLLRSERKKRETQAAGGLCVRQQKKGEGARLGPALMQMLCGRTDCTACRDAAYMETLLSEVESEDGQLLWFYEAEAEEPCGFAALWGLEEKEVRELVCRDGMENEVIERLTQYLEESEDGPKQQEAPTPEKVPQIPVHGSLTPLTETKPLIMGRIVCAEKFLELFSAERAITIRLSLTDVFLPENTGTYLWKLDETGSRAVRICESDRGGAPKAERSGRSKAESEQEAELSVTSEELFLWLAKGETGLGPAEVRSWKKPFLNEIV